MRVAIISDIHGNLRALDAVLADIACRRVDLTVNLGDLVSGPLQPAETADRLMRLNLPTVRGNHERQLLTFETQRMGESDRHAALHLTDTHRAWLAEFPATALTAGDIFLCHGTPANDLDYFVETIDASGLRIATEEDVAARAADAPGTLLLCGHTHLPRSVQLADGRSVLNPGSVGLQAYEARFPFPHTIQTGSPHARYAVAERAANTWQIELIQVEYDWETQARLAEKNGRPEWARALRTGQV